MKMRSNPQALLFVLAVMLGFVSGGVGGARAAQDGETFFDSRAHVKVKAVAQRTNVSPGDTIAVAVVLEHQPTFHTWANEGNRPEGAAEFEGAVFTAVANGKKTSSSLAVYVGAIQWPAVHLITADVGEGPQEYAVFSDRAVLYVPVTVKADAVLGRATLVLEVTFQACDDTTCAPPVFDLELPVELEIVEAGTATAVAADEALFSGFDPSVFSSLLSGTATEPAVEPAPVDVKTPASSRGRFFGFTLPDSGSLAGQIALVLLSIVGGFILNLTPCVLPIIPIKIMTISKHAGSPGRGLVLGMWMAIGVVAFWVGIGVPAALFTSFADPSRLFGIWWLTLGIGVIIAAMGVGIMGMFQIRLPNAVYAVNPKADSASGSFLFGVMTGVLGLPCFGFVAGALLVGAATLPPIFVMMIFASIGIGMAAPYLILSAFPKLVDALPRTGPASELVKQVLGLLLLAAAAYFIGSGLITLVLDYPYFGRQLHWWAVALFAVMAGVWLTIRTIQITARPGPRVVFGVISLVIAGVAVVYALDTTGKAKDTWLAQESARQEGGTALVAGVWNEYTPAAFESARASGRTVVLDFTAEWCLTCKALKATVLNRDPVKTALMGEDVVTFTVDLTSNRAPGWETLRSLGKTGIPLLAVYSPGEDSQPWMANAYTADDVITALGAAKPKQAAAR